MENIDKLVKSIAGIYRDAEQEFTPMVEDLIHNDCRDPQRITWLLDRMLGYANYAPILLLHRRLCRHYYFIDPEDTKWHVYKYKEMWEHIDDADEETME